MSTDDKRAARNLRRYLRGLTDTVTIVIAALDEEMKRPSTPERGQRIALICNALEMANDQARHFGLGQSLKPRKVKIPSP